MDKPYISSVPLKDLPLWEKIAKKRRLFSFDLEITARCNLNCRHCYINLPANDKDVQKKEISTKKTGEIADEAVSLGALWCLLTGGEPLLRKDFFNIYLSLKKKGLLLSINTNACLITQKHVDFFKKYPPRDIEITVYGVTQKTYEGITRKKGSFSAFQRGLGLLLDSGVRVRLKAMALRSNLHEWSDIAKFCREKTKDYYRFDPFLHLRYDGDPKKNKDIITERLSPEEIVSLERSDPERFQALTNNCDQLIISEDRSTECNHLFNCGAGVGHCVINYDGFFRLCFSLWHPDCVYDLKKGNLHDAWNKFVPRIRQMYSNRKELQQKCLICPIVNLCMWCPAHAFLETGKLDIPVDYFCQVAHAREKSLKNP